jgi:hypothetical protein
VSLRSVSFTFGAATTADAQQRALDDIGRWDGIVTARFLKPGARNPEIARMAYVVLAEDVEADAVVRRIQAVPGVESASVPPPRYLADE